MLSAYKRWVSSTGRISGMRTGPLRYFAFPPGR